MRRLAPAALLAAALLFGSPPRPARSAPQIAPGALCQAAIRDVQTTARLPKGLLGAIGMVESGRPDPDSGAVAPWPWTIDAEGQPAFFASREDAVAAVRALQAHGVASIDVGCMQVNLVHHPQAFASLDEAFDPARNAAYAARFLTQLFAQTHDWPSAAALYHSTTPDLAEAYQRRVMAAWGVRPSPVPAASGGARIASLPAGPVAVMLPAAPGGDIRVIPLGDGRTVPVPVSAIRRAPRAAARAARGG